MTNATILIIVGITGDLANRKLLPAIAELAAAGKLPEQFKILGITRRDITKEEVVSGVQIPDPTFIADHLEMLTMNLESLEDYHKLGLAIADAERAFGAAAQKLFYLSVPPQYSLPIITHLGESGLSRQPETKLLLEKPFGFDLDSAREMVGHIGRYFDEDQVYRIDHYLAKEMAQNLLVFRSGNSLFKRTWNRDFIESIEIIAAESIGIEGRTTFYEQTGALRDVVQSHLLQLAALTLMDLPAPGQAVPPLRLSALNQIAHAGLTEPNQVIRGQYAGYESEVGNPHTAVETFVSLTLFSQGPNWQGVPITLVTGKKLDIKTTEIRVRYRRQEAEEANDLRLRIQPQEGIEFCIWSKKPGYERDLEQDWLQFKYGDQSQGLPDAYGQVLLDSIRSDHTLFTSSEEVLASWQIIQPILNSWSLDSASLVTYEPGSKWQEISG